MRVQAHALLALLGLLAAGLGAVAVAPADPLPTMPRFVVATPQGRVGSLEATPEELEADGFPTYAAGLRSPGTPIVAPPEERSRFQGQAPGPFLLSNGTWFVRAGVAGNGSAGYEYFERSVEDDPSPWRTTPEQLGDQGFHFVRTAVERPGVEVAIDLRTDVARRFTRALAVAGARHLEVEGQQYLVQWRSPAYPPMSPADASFSVIVQLLPVDEGVAWSTTPDALEEAWLPSLAEALRAPGGFVGLSGCGNIPCAEVAALHEALRVHNASRLAWAGTTYGVHYLHHPAPGGDTSASRVLDHGVLVHRSNEEGTFWAVSPEGLREEGMPTFAEALGRPGVYQPWPAGGDEAESRAFKLALQEREALHLRWNGTLWEATPTTRYRLESPGPRQQDAPEGGEAVELGRDGERTGTTATPEDPTPSPSGGGPKVVSLAPLLAVLALAFAASRRRRA